MSGGIARVDTFLYNLQDVARGLLAAGLLRPAVGIGFGQFLFLDFTHQIEKHLDT